MTDGQQSLDNFDSEENVKTWWLSDEYWIIRGIFFDDQAQKVLCITATAATEAADCVDEWAKWVGQITINNFSLVLEC